MEQYLFAVIKAYIHGINSSEYNTKRTVKGYGLNRGIDEFNKSFKQTYLFRTQEELTELGIEFSVPEFITKELTDGYTTF